jgi:hypothetical protein
MCKTPNLYECLLAVWLVLPGLATGQTPAVLPDTTLFYWQQSLPLERLWFLGPTTAVAYRQDDKLRSYLYLLSPHNLITDTLATDDFQGLMPLGSQRAHLRGLFRSRALAVRAGRLELALLAPPRVALPTGAAFALPLADGVLYRRVMPHKGKKDSDSTSSQLFFAAPGQQAKLLVGREWPRQAPLQPSFVEALAPGAYWVFSAQAACFYQFSLPHLQRVSRAWLPTEAGHRWAYHYDHLQAKHYFVGEKAGQKQLYEFVDGALTWIASLHFWPDQVVAGLLYFRKPTAKPGDFEHHLLPLRALAGAGSKGAPIPLRY